MEIIFKFTADSFVLVWSLNTTNLFFFFPFSFSYCRFYGWYWDGMGDRGWRVYLWFEIPCQDWPLLSLAVCSPMRFYSDIYSVKKEDVFSWGEKEKKILSQVIATSIYFKSYTVALVTWSCDENLNPFSIIHSHRTCSINNS